VEVLQFNHDAEEQKIFNLDAAARTWVHAIEQQLTDDVSGGKNGVRM